MRPSVPDHRRPAGSPVCVAPGRGETWVDTGLRFHPDAPVLVRVVHRDRRTSVSDDGAAIALAGRPGRWHEAARRVGRELDVNVTRAGVVCLPVVPAGPREDEIVGRIGEASLAFYQDLLELTE